MATRSRLIIRSGLKINHTCFRNISIPSKHFYDVAVPNRLFAVSEDGELTVTGLQCRRHDTPPLLKRVQHEVLSFLAEASGYPAYLDKLKVGREILSRYLEHLASGSVDLEDFIVSKRITREPRDYHKASLAAIAAQQLFGKGVKLRPGQTVEYIITDSQSNVPNDRVRAYSLWEGWHGHDRQKYNAMLREAFDRSSNSRLPHVRFLIRSI